MKGYFFNAVPTEDLSTYPTGYDRNYDADDFGEFFNGFFSNGVLIKSSDNECLVTVSGLTLNVNEGFAIINGHGIVVEGTETASVTSSGYAVIRWDKTVAKREAEFLVVKSVQQTDDIYDLVLANVTLSSSDTVTVTDARTYAAYSGKVVAVDNIKAAADAASENASSAINKITGTAIASGADLNDCVTPGNYYCDTLTICNSLTNCPVTSRVFSLEVLTSTSTNSRRIQILTAHYTSTSTSYGAGKPTISVRTKYAASAWTDWVQVYTSNDTIPDMEAVQAAINGTAIASGADLDDMTTPGNFYCNTFTICNSLVNCPVTNRVFSLEVLTSSVANVRRVQRLTAHYSSNSSVYGGGKPGIWERVKFSSTVWGDWVQVYTSNDAVLETGTLSLTDNQTKTSVTNSTTYTKFTLGDSSYIEIDLKYEFKPSASATSFVLYGFPAPKQATARIPFSAPNLPCYTGQYQIPNGFNVSASGSAQFILLSLGLGESGQWGWNTQAGKTHTVEAHFGYFLA